MEENKIINAILKHKDDMDIIELYFDEILEINLSKNEQSDLKKVFANMVKSALKEKFEIKLDIDDSSCNQIIIAIAKGYIDELNKELKSLYEEEYFNEIYGE